MPLDSINQGHPKNPALVFLHAFPLNAEMWHEQMAEFAADYHCVSPDLPGFGETPGPKHAFTFEHYADATIAFLKEKKIENAVWCGLSMGGYLALRMYEKAPKLCRALILCDTKAGADANEAKLKRWGGIELLTKSREEFAQAQFKALIGKSGQKNKDLKARVESLIEQSGTAGIASGLTALATRTDTTEGLKKIKVPTLILVGEEDVPTPPAEAKKLRRAIKNSQLKILKKAGHLSNLEAPALFNLEVSNFLKSLK